MEGARFRTLEPTKKCVAVIKVLSLARRRECGCCTTGNVPRAIAQLSAGTDAVMAHVFVCKVWVYSVSPGKNPVTSLVVRLQVLQKDEQWSWGKLEKSGEEGW